MKNKDYILYLDMDGVLVDFNGGYRLLSKGKSLQETAESDGAQQAREKYLQAGEEFWANLDWIHGGKELWNASSKLFKRIAILSSAGTSDPVRGAMVIAGKQKWLAKNIPAITSDNIFIVMGKHLKQQYAAKNSILVDDVWITIDEWNKQGGYGILHNSNQYKKTIEELEDISRPIKIAEMIRRIKK